MSILSALPKVSIIIPIYNVQDYVKQCLQTVLKQTYAPLEIIIVNDATPDDSMKVVREVVRQYQREVIIVEHTENKGLGGARNTGIKVATGTYLMFLDSDDWMDEDYIEQMIKIAATYDLDVLLGPIKSYSDSTKKYWIDRYFTPTCLQDKKYDNPFIIKDFEQFTSNNLGTIFDMFPVVAFGKLYKRHLFEAHLYPEGCIFEDEGFFKVLIWIIKNIGFYHTENSWLFYRRNRQGSIISEFYNKGEKALDILKITDFILEHTARLAPKRIGFAQSMKINCIFNFSIRLYDIDRNSLSTMHKVGILAASLQNFLRTLTHKTILALPNMNEARKQLILTIKDTEISVLDLAHKMFYGFDNNTIGQHELSLRFILHLFKIWTKDKIKKQGIEKKPRLIRLFFITRVLWNAFRQYLRERKQKV